jgi:hypothetical protein
MYWPCYSFLTIPGVRRCPLAYAGRPPSSKPLANLRSTLKDYADSSFYRDGATAQRIGRNLTISCENHPTRQMRPVRDTLVHILVHFPGSVEYRP